MAICAGVAFGAFYLATGGRLRPDDWVARQILAISQTYVVPTMQFSRFEYVVPNRAVFHGVSFVAPDGLHVIEAEHLTFTLAERPRQGRPIRLGEVRIEGGRLTLARGRTPEEGAFRGLVPFVRASAIRQQESVPREARLSEVLRINRIHLVNCSIVYDDATGRDPMTLDGINLNTVIEPGQIDGGNVWHKVTATIARAPLIDLKIDGRLDLDDYVIRFDDLSLQASIEESTIRTLPQDLQTVLVDHDVQGDLSITGRGDLPIGNLPAANLSGQINLQDANFAFASTQVPVERFESTYAISSGVFYLRNVVAELLDGELNGEASFDMAHPDGDAKVRWNATGWSVAQMLRPGAARKDAPRTGKLDSTGAVQWSPRDASNLAGRAQLSLKGGSVTAFPILRNLREPLTVLNVIDDSWLDDTFSTELLIDATRVSTQEFDFSSGAIGGKGYGWISYDGAIDVNFSAGPVQRFLGGGGPIRNLLTGVTGRIVRYRVSGTLDSPRVSVLPLGIGG